MLEMFCSPAKADMKVLSLSLPRLKPASQVNATCSLRTDPAQLEMAKRWFVPQLAGFSSCYFIYHLSPIPTLFLCPSAPAQGMNWLLLPSHSPSSCQEGSQLGAGVVPGTSGSRFAWSSSCPAELVGGCCAQHCCLRLQLDSFKRNTKHQPGLFSVHTHPLYFF